MLQCLLMLKQQFKSIEKYTDIDKFISNVFMSSKLVIMTTWCTSAFVGMVSRKVEEKIYDVIINDVYDYRNLLLTVSKGRA